MSLLAKKSSEEGPETVKPIYKETGLRKKIGS
jgi:hypothetical protein